MPADSKTDRTAPEARAVAPPASPSRGSDDARSSLARSLVALSAATAIPTVLFLACPPLSKSGLWDPYELNVADLSRRIALNLYQAKALALDGADNSLPHLNDLGRPQLAFSSIALGFKVFGLHEWAGRLPLALWGVLGVVATYAFVARLFDRRTGLYAAVVLSTMPLYFVQARSMMGEVCSMAGMAMAFGGFAVAVFDRQPIARDAASDSVPTSWYRRIPWLAMGLVGGLVGLESRGALLGLAVPWLGVGLAWAVTRTATASRQADRTGDVIGAASLLLGAAVTVAALRSVSRPGRDLDLWVGAVVHAPAKYATFDSFIAEIGHSLAPWSAFLPFAVGLLVLAPAAGARPSGTFERESHGRVALLVGLALAFVGHAYLVDHTDVPVFTGSAICAVVCAVAIREFERGGHAAVAVSVGVVVLAAVLHHDFHELPEKAYQAFGVAGAQFPEGFKERALAIWWKVLGGFALCAFLTWVERDPKRPPFDPASYARVLREMRQALDGALLFLYTVLVAGGAIAGLVLYAGIRWHAPWLPQMSSTFRDLALNAWWVIALAPLVCVLAPIFACDVWLWTFGGSRSPSARSFVRGFEPFEELLTTLGSARRSWKSAGAESWLGLAAVTTLMFLAIPAAAFALLHAEGVRPLIAAAAAVSSGLLAFLLLGAFGDVLRHRGVGFVVGGGLSGLALCFWYYPALANQLSPKDVFESYRRECPGAPLALLGVGGRTSAYYAGGQPEAFTDPTSAFRWLSAVGEQRRCLALKAEELPKLNQLWRVRNDDRRSNLPVVDARSSQILLAASSLSSGDKNENPLTEIVLTTTPRPWRKIEANLDDKLVVLGIDIADDRGHLVDFVSAGRTYHLRTYYRVTAPVTTEWEAFIHIDGYHRRHNGDHKPLNGKYPMSLWLPGDILMDDHEFKLEPNFTPGTYGIYFGLFVGDTRMKVLSGPSDGENRINGGELRVQ